MFFEIWRIPRNRQTYFWRLSSRFKKCLCGNSRWILKSENYEKTKDLDVDLSDVEFEIELLKTDEINLDYILALIVEKSKILSLKK